MHLHIATSNPGKLRDFAAAATPGFRIEPLPHLATIPAPPEDAPTFAENAISKALYYSRQAPGLIVLADDSGLEVDALNGAPGVRSARFAQDYSENSKSSGFTPRPSMPTDARNLLCLLDALGSTRDGSRTARYRSVLAAAQDGQLLATGEGTVEGEILAVPRGNSGFGYDPVFLLPDLGLTMAELPTAQKLAFSHRGQALQSLLAKLRPA